LSTTLLTKDTRNVIIDRDDDDRSTESWDGLIARSKAPTPSSIILPSRTGSIQNFIMRHSVCQLMLVVATLLSASVEAFQGIHQLPHSTRPWQMSRTSLYAGGKEEAIEKLEEQLRKLREEGPGDEVDSDAMNVAEPNEEIVDEAMFLSEYWKEGDATESEASSGFSPILGAVGLAGLAILLAFFAQVPIGQEDLSKYSVIKAPTEQLDLGDLNRARQSGDL
jgi:hypothetical protein